MKPIKRARATAIIETEHGILMVLLDGPFAILPGGGVEEGESTQEALRREVKEELGLEVTSSKYLFAMVGNNTKMFGGRSAVNHYKVYSVTATGVPRSQNEIRKILYYEKGADLPMSRTAAKILDKYLSQKKG